MKTLLLDRTRWDLIKDAAGNIAFADVPYARAQDAASAIRTFTNEVWYDQASGIPYFEEVLGHDPPLQLMKSLFIEQALTVPGVVSAQCYITSVIGRKVSGQVLITDVDGVQSVATF